jgi:transposase
MDSLDLKPLMNAYRGTGSQPYPLQCMLAIALFEILDTVSSPAKWFRHAATRDECRLLGQGIQPARSTWYEFRDRVGRFIEEVHQQMIRRAMDEKIVEPEECSLDGTFTRAAASRHRLLTLKRLSKRLRTLKLAVLQDESDGNVQDGVFPKWVGATPDGREEQLQRYRNAKRRMLEKVAKNRKKPRKYQRDESRFLINPTDIDAVIGRDKEKVCGPIYNTQYMVACGTDLIVAYDVFAQCCDTGTLAPMIQRTQRFVRGRLRTVHADSGYCSLLELGDCQTLGIELFAPVQEVVKKGGQGQTLYSARDFTFFLQEGRCRCPAGHEMTQRARGVKPRADGRCVVEVRYEQSANRCHDCTHASRCLKPGSRRRSVSRLEGQELLDAQRAKMESDAGKRSLRLRGKTVERLFGDGKRHRNQNQQNGRGLHRVKAEVGLLVVAQNALRLYNLRKQRE